MSYRIQVSSSAAKYLKKLDKPNRDRVEIRLRALEANPYAESKPIVNSEPARRSSRIGDLRIVIEILQVENVVLIVDIKPRGDVYKKY